MQSLLSGHATGDEASFNGPAALAPASDTSSAQASAPTDTQRSPEAEARRGSSPTTGVARGASVYSCVLALEAHVRSYKLVQSLPDCLTPRYVWLCWLYVDYLLVTGHVPVRIRTGKR